MLPPAVGHQVEQNKPAPQEMDHRMQHLCYTYRGLWEEQPPTHTSRTSVPNSRMCTNPYTLLSSRNSHSGEREPMEREEGAGDQLFWTARCLLQHAVSSWKVV